ncbi:unnamed protein product [Ranitomeya imitator]|uniref:Secreted protein n=1 Tax=Ranitomeya imitator TaxID=111125 RepID=A0ABN9LN95_9NEOB|nr:unnamed protein product [Ranitomeya imitator]
MVAAVVAAVVAMEAAVVEVATTVVAADDSNGGDDSTPERGVYLIRPLSQSFHGLQNICSSNVGATIPGATHHCSHQCSIRANVHSDDKGRRLNGRVQCDKLHPTLTNFKLWGPLPPADCRPFYSVRDNRSMLRLSRTEENSRLTRTHISLWGRVRQRTPIGYHRSAVRYKRTPAMEEMEKLISPQLCSDPPCARENLSTDA